jgi:hypothetical protein
MNAERLLDLCDRVAESPDAVARQRRRRRRSRLGERFGAVHLDRILVVTVVHARRDLSRQRSAPPS